MKSHSVDSCIVDPESSFSRLSHLVALLPSPSFLLPSSMSLRQIAQFVHSLVDGHESCIVFAAMNILVTNLFVGIYFSFFGDNYRSGMV